MSVVERPAGHTDECVACETKETRYWLTLSASIWLSGAPGCHTKEILLENTIAWLKAVYESGGAEDVFDTVTAEETRVSE